ncbi:lamin [Schistosoma japonicum]|nr:lamin [Schistosoma japonicum]
MSISGSKDKSFQYSNHNNLETFKPNTAGINVAQYISSKGFQPGDAVSNKEPVSEFLPLRLPDISISDARVESPQNFKYHLKKLHSAVNKILENDRITKHRTPPKKHFKGNQEAYEKMLDAVRNLSSFLQRQTTSSSSDYTRISNEIQSRFPIKVRSKSTTYDNSVNRRRNLAGKLGLRFKSVGRTASLTKRPRSPLHYSVFPYSVFDRRHSPCSERLGNTEGRGIFQRKAMHKLSVTKGVSLNSNKETENVYVSQVFTHPEVACLEAELSHRDTLIKYLSEELLKMHQDNNRIFSEYELQEASLTNHLRLLRSRLTDTIYDRDQPCTITNLTTNNSLYTGYTQSLSQHVNYNITDSIVHHFATEINHKLLHSNMNSNSSTNMDKDKRLQQLLFELQELGLATQNLLTYWEMKSREINYPSVCQHFFKALLNFFIVSMKPCFVTESNKFMDSNMKELQVRAEKSEQQVTELSCEIKNYQIQLDKLNRQFTRRLEEVSIERLKHKRIGIESNPSVNSSVMPSANILRRVASSSNVENISTVDNKFIKTDEYQYMISVDTESNCRVHGDTLNLISSRTKDIRLSKPTIMPICVSSRDDSVSNLLQRLRVLLLSKESKLKGTNLHKSKLWSVHKEEYETLYRVYDIIEEFHLNKQNSESLSSLKSFGLITPQSSLSTKIYFVPEPAIIGIDKTTSTDELFPVFEVQSATISDKDTTILTNQSTTTTMSSNHDQVKINRENSELHSYNKDKQKEITVKSSRKDKYCSKYSTKPIYFTDTYTPTCSSLTSGICKIHNYQLQVQQLSQMNDQASHSMLLLTLRCMKT